MAVKEWKNYARKYFKRFASPDPLLVETPDQETQISIVIPCHNEPDLIGTLESLANCDSASSSVEVIVVVNQGENVAQPVKDQNAKTIKDFNSWNARQANKSLRFHLVDALDMPKKHAGVGLARKIGMDEALRRFCQTDVDGTIVCLDADCRVSANYLLAIDSQFAKHGAGLGEMHYEHPYDQETDEGLKTGIVNYELFLRYYVEGLRQAGFPNAIQTVGSCMIVRASVYAKHGGMNKRKAGEDFYFLHKIIPHEKFMNVNQATVYPSCRTSDRVPFGTGKAQQDWLNQESGEYLTYDPAIFEELKALLNQVPAFFSLSREALLPTLSEANQQFLREHDCLEKIALIKTNTVNEAQFVKQFYIWFDGFMCMKYVHFFRGCFYPNQAIEKVAALLVGLEQTGATELLRHYRLIDLQH